MKVNLQRKNRVQSEINITPFTDVVLVLLVVFMIATPALVEKGIKISLPKAGSGSDRPDKPLTVEIDKNEIIYLNGEKFSLDSLASELRRRSKDNAEISLTVKADRQAPYKTIIAVLDKSRAAGIRHVSLGVDAQ